MHRTYLTSSNSTCFLFLKFKPDFTKSLLFILSCIWWLEAAETHFSLDLVGGSSLVAEVCCLDVDGGVSAAGVSSIDVDCGVSDIVDEVPSSGVT